jgi:hypothetical protein
MEGVPKAIHAASSGSDSCANASNVPAGKGEKFVDGGGLDALFLPVFLQDEAGVGVTGAAAEKSAVVSIMSSIPTLEAQRGGRGVLSLSLSVSQSDINVTTLTSLTQVATKGKDLRARRE